MVCSYDNGIVNDEQIHIFMAWAQRRMAFGVTKTANNILTLLEETQDDLHGQRASLEPSKGCVEPVVFNSP